MKGYRRDYEAVVDFEEVAEYALVLVRMGAVREQVRALAE